MINIIHDPLDNAWAVWSDPEGDEQTGNCIGVGPTEKEAIAAALTQLGEDLAQLRLTYETLEDVPKIEAVKMHVAPRNYTLDADWNPIPEKDLTAWAVWFQKADRAVALTQLGESRVSTIFLALDHSYRPGPPVLWETMVFGGDLDQEQDRCSGTKSDAQAMHARMVQRVKNHTPATV